uniref:(2Fe-2S)-binding protein n=1 Tax=Fervidobacterium pennivorans TaxID=93466 RepID=A0A7V4KC35_FERPE
MRIKEHPILSVPSEKTYLTFYFEGQIVYATSEDTIASALIANGFDVFGFTEHNHPRGFFCAIGKCSACLVEVDGIPNVRACITPVREGMHVKMQVGRGKPKW